MGTSCVAFSFGLKSIFATQNGRAFQIAMTADSEAKKLLLKIKLEQMRSTWRKCAASTGNRKREEQEQRQKKWVAGGGGVVGEQRGHPQAEAKGKIK